MLLHSAQRVGTRAHSASQQHTRAAQYGVLIDCQQACGLPGDAGSCGEEPRTGRGWRRAQAIHASSWASCLAPASRYVINLPAHNGLVLLMACYQCSNGDLDAASQVFLSTTECGPTHIRCPTELIMILHIRCYGISLMLASSASILICLFSSANPGTPSDANSSGAAAPI